MSELHPLEAEYLRAAAKMTATEILLSRALLNQNDGLAAATVLLDLLTDESAPGYDAAHSLVAVEVARILREAFSQGHAAHVALVAHINRPVVH